ncbi:MAG: DUF6261 family protein [Mediterranea sp.]|jgi:hypothetical protein|nr:DUF6261 family protein [Mediterranea sp.]
MAKKPIQAFKFHGLKLSEFIELQRLFFDHALPLALAQILGVSKVYNQAKASFDELTEIFRRNPALLQTEKLVNTIAGVRRRMVALKAMLRGMLGYIEGERLDSAKIMENVAHPYLKTAYNDTQAALVANAIEMVDALRTAAILPLLTQSGLKTIVDEIAALARQAEEILYARGEEKAFRKALGSSDSIRRKLEKQLRFLIGVSIPAQYNEAAGTPAASFEHAITEINGLLNSFRHLISAGGGNEPDTQPAEPPSGEWENYPS